MSQSEFDIIRSYFAGSGLAIPKSEVVLGIGDDGALLQIPDGKQLCVTLDVLVEGRHFPSGADPALVANRALAVNLSDLAAMGASPLCFTLGLTLPASDEHWLAQFSSGLLPLARRYHLPLVGGDLSAGPLVIAIQAHGLVTPGKAIRRDGATVGDSIYVSGCLGDAALALVMMKQSSHLDAILPTPAQALPEKCRAYLEDAYYRPEPRVDLGNACAELVSSGIDISDGLYGDLGHIVSASGVSAVIRPHALPVSECARAFIDSDLHWAALLGGDDYELCVTVPGDRCEEFEDTAAALHTRVTRIGEVVAGSGVRCVDGAGREMAVPGQSYQHFR